MKFIGKLLVFVFSPTGDFSKQAAFAVCIREISFHRAILLELLLE